MKEFEDLDKVLRKLFAEWDFSHALEIDFSEEFAGLDEAIKEETKNWTEWR